ncbi:MAG: hypothetical protein LBC71_07000, partial [Oscillospiraceae bacterium]|nr:hypothetical protein [Oscillospiraceae bacterium]
EIKKKEIMTLRELKKKYSTKWFRYVIVGEINLLNPDSDMCYVVCTADTDDELYRNPRPDLIEQFNGGIASGYDVEYPVEIGGIYAHA